MCRSLILLALVACAAPPVVAPSPPAPIIRYPRGAIALVHARLFDGTLAPARDDQSVILDGALIRTVGPSATTAVPAGATVIDLAGRAILPGLVGMHDHLFYVDVAFPRAAGDPVLPLLPELAHSAPRLYLAAGVTTVRTAGSVEPYADLHLRQRIERGEPGPELDVTAPYMEGAGGDFPQMSELTDPDRARRFVAFWADAGATSFKAYMHLSRAVLAAAIDEAHRRHLKVTGHLCAVTYAEAAAAGIDNLEHGLFAATDLDPHKQPDVCPETADDAPPVLALDPDAPAVNDLLRTLVDHHVALTSTLPVYEDLMPGHGLEPRVLAVLAPDVAASYRDRRRRIDARPEAGAHERFRREQRLERAFVAAGGLLLAGADPTGVGGVLPGFGDQRELELLVDAGFSAVEAIHIATANGARYLERLDRVGTVEPGKQADLVIVRGDPGARIRDVENVELVFKRSTGYDAAALIDSVRGEVGLR
jgi:imidazolonepropionase-like amidohydrolase